MSRIELGLTLIGVSFLAALVGCDGATTQERFRQLNQQVRELSDRADKLTQEAAAREALVTAQQKQIASLQAMRRSFKALESLQWRFGNPSPAIYEFASYPFDRLFPDVTGATSTPAR